MAPLQDTPFSNLRFMDFLSTNNSPNRYWKDRTKPSNYTMGTEYGAAWELVIDLCNKMSPMDCWINIPHLADDDYVQNLAQMWYANYTGKGVIHIEYRYVNRFIYLLHSGSLIYHPKINTQKQQRMLEWNIPMLSLYG